MEKLKKGTKLLPRKKCIAISQKCLRSLLAAQLNFAASTPNFPSPRGIREKRRVRVKSQGGRIY